MTEPDINSVGELVERLGGYSEAAKALDCDIRVLRMWNTRKGIPARYFFKHTPILQDAGIRANPSLWNFEPAPVQQ